MLWIGIYKRRANLARFERNDAGMSKNKLPTKRNMYGTRHKNLKFDVIEGNV